MLDQVSVRTEFFGELIPASIVKLWSSSSQRQLIGQVELLPVLMAKFTWAVLIRKRLVLHFIDSDSAPFALVNGTSSCYPPCALQLAPASRMSPFMHSPGMPGCQVAATSVTVRAVWSFPKLRHCPRLSELVPGLSALFTCSRGADGRPCFQRLHG